MPKPDGAVIAKRTSASRDRRQAQQAAEALEQALHDLGIPEDLVAELEGRLRSQQKLLSKICGVMFPPLFGCRTNAQLCRVRGWDKNLPSRLLSALPKRSCLAQAAPTLGRGRARATVTLCRQRECGHTQPLAMDLGRR